jgi:endonuclease YncB( thermonuclease family)
VDAGDVLTIEGPAGRLRVVLAAIDAPEPDQPHGVAARLALARRAMGADAMVRAVTPPRRGCVVGEVRIAGVDLARIQLREGHVWATPEAAQALIELERDARRAERGLWRSYAPVPPWEWRARLGRGAAGSCP